MSVHKKQLLLYNQFSIFFFKFVKSVGRKFSIGKSFLLSLTKLFFPKIKGSF